MGGPPAWAMKLVKPEVAVNKAPTQVGAVLLLDPGGKTKRCAKKSKVVKPTKPATQRDSMYLNSKKPTPMPTMPQGIKNRSNFRSYSRRKACKPSKSITNKMGINMAAACGTVMAIAMMGTANEPKPAPNPLLLKPSNKTAGTANA